MNLEESFRQWVTQRLNQAMDKTIANQICKRKMVVGDGKTIFTEKDRQQMRQFLSEHTN